MEERICPKEAEWKAIFTHISKLSSVSEIAAIDMLKEIKSRSRTYGEVKQKLKRISKDIAFENQDKYYHFFSMIDELLTEEMNDLPLTYRS